MQSATLTIGDIFDLFTAMQHVRDALMFRTMYAAALREKELVSFRFVDLELDRQTLFVRAPGKLSDRYVLLDPLTCELLRAWARNQPVENRVFPMAATQLWTRLKLWTDASGLTAKYAGKRISPHTFRYSLASHVDAAGMPLATIQMLLGCYDLPGTAAYIEADPTLLARRYREALEGVRGPSPTVSPGEFRNGRLPYIVTPAEVEALRSVPEASFLVQFLYRSGLLLSELPEVDLTTLDPSLGTLRLPSRTVALDADTVAALTVHALPPNPEEVLRAAADRTGLAARYAAMERPFDPDCLRHAYASHLLEAGLDFLTLHRLLGSPYWETTQTYLWTSPRRWRDEYLRYHPLARLQR